MVSSFVITGFLGVGKSSMLVNSVQKHFGDKKVAIIVNEFGDIGIDGNILSNVYSEVLEISEGCICCQLAQEFEGGVMEILNKYNPEIIFVETSGASEPFPIFLSLQNLGISVEGIVCVVDAKNFDAYKDNATAKYQIGGSNILVLNKTDLVNDDELIAVEQEVVSVKEQYNIKNSLTEQPMFNGYVINHAEQGMVNKELFDGVYQISEIASMARDYHHHDHTAKDAITQKVAYLKEGVTFADMEAVLKALPANIYRVKGIVKTTDVPNPLMVNYAFGNVSFNEMADYKESSILIFIGESIENHVSQLQKQFDFLMVPQFKLSQ